LRQSKRAKLKAGNETITPFKGLGEISPKEFQQFISKEMVLAQGHHVWNPRRALSPA